MTLGEAIAMGVVQGLTEFLPISSSGHLRIVPALMGWSDPGAGFTAVIQLGTLVAVVLFFRGDIGRMLRGTWAGLRAGQPLNNPDARLAWMIVLATVPIVLCGLLFKDAIKTSLRSLEITAAMLIGIGLLMAVAEVWHARRGRTRGVADAGWWDAITIGLAQAVALIPGTSRSGVTISAALFRDFNRPSAARLSFLLSLPSIFAAGVYQLYDARRELLSTSEGVVHLLVATIVSGLVGYASIAFLLRYLRTRTTGVFIVYRILLGIALFVLIGQGVIEL